MHNSGKGSRYVRGHLPAQLRRSWPVNGRAEAQRMEALIKKKSHAEKAAMIRVHRTDYLHAYFHRTSSAH
jgi:predicted GIY-YIG superfamily endonuclease